MKFIKKKEKIMSNTMVIVFKSITLFHSHFLVYEFDVHAEAN